jgi:hypothetical protein
MPLRWAWIKPTIWANLIDWKCLLKLSEEWRSLEAKIREVCVQIPGAKEHSGEIPKLRDSLADTVEQV